jgi:hypothetical protein
MLLHQALWQSGKLDEQKILETRLLEQIETLLFTRADVKFCPSSFGTYVHLACRIEIISLVVLFLKYGADPNATDTGSKSPLNVLLISNSGSNRTVTENSIHHFLCNAPEVRIRIDDVALALELHKHDHGLGTSSKNIVRCCWVVIAPYFPPLILEIWLGQTLKP